jgi:hypothetical protein
MAGKLKPLGKVLEKGGKGRRWAGRGDEGRVGRGDTGKVGRGIDGW